jgi:hypothetical protein
MSATRRDPLAGWRAARAARASEAAPVAGTVSTVSTALPVVETPGEAQETANVSTVSIVSSQNGEETTAAAARDPWGLSEADKAQAAARLSRVGERAQPAPMDHDAGERTAMAAHYAEEAAAQPYQPRGPDPLRDGLHRGFHAHRAAWEALPPGPERGRAFAEVRREPGACPTCAGLRWWCEVGEPVTARRCTTCHPPDHLPTNAIHEVTT